VKCGQSPLYVGQNESCNACGKLVCHQCGYCAKSCQACAPRQAEWPVIKRDDDLLRPDVIGGDELPF
jgi:hypothetical protein